jgi:hypothetical protein
LNRGARIGSIGSNSSIGNCFGLEVQKIKRQRLLLEKRRPTRYRDMTFQVPGDCPGRRLHRRLTQPFAAPLDESKYAIQVQDGGQSLNG